LPEIRHLGVESGLRENLGQSRSDCVIARRSDTSHRETTKHENLKWVLSFVGCSDAVIPGVSQTVFSNIYVLPGEWSA
jgi:hypothetical protein